MRNLLKPLALCAALLAGCGGGGGDESKDLFSLWTRDGDGVKLELSGGSFGTDGLINFFCTDPLPPRFEVNFKLPEEIGVGGHALEMKMGKRVVAPIGIEVVA